MNKVLQGGLSRRFVTGLKLVGRRGTGLSMFDTCTGGDPAAAAAAAAAAARKAGAAGLSGAPFNAALPAICDTGAMIVVGVM